MPADGLPRSISPTPVYWQANLSFLSLLSQGVGPIKSWAPPSWVTVPGKRVKKRISFRGNSPRTPIGPVISPGLSKWVTVSGAHAQIRKNKGGITHEKTGHQNHSRDAPARKEQQRNFSGRGHLIKHHSIPCPSPPGILWWQAVPELWPSHGSADRSESKTLLLRQMPHGMVEQPPGAGSEASLLHPRMCPLRKGV